MAEGDMASFFYNGSGLSLGVNLVSTNTGRPSHFAIIFRLFPNGGEKNVAGRLFFFGTSLVGGGAPTGMSVDFVVQKNRRYDLAYVQYKSRIITKQDCILR